MEIPEGHVGNLSPLEQQRLRQFWSKLTGIIGVKQQYSPGTAAGNGTGTATTTTAAATHDTNDKYGQSDAFTSYLASEPPSAIRRAFWAAVKNDNPDSLVLRFLRARKWDVDKAVVMLVTMIQWREQQNINDIVVRGDSGGIDGGSGGKERRSDDEEGLILQYRLGKSFVRGLDVNNRPVYIVKPALHSQKTQTARAMELYILHTVESIRLLVKDPFDTTCLIFDLTGFSLRNMDFPTVKFLIQVFEARYPETLGVVLIHNAPWVFQGIWRIVKGWLDPVVAGKINFSSKPADLEAFIPRKNLTAEYGGLDDYTYAFVEPREGENDAMRDIPRIQQLTAERETIIAEYEKATVEWCCGGAVGAAAAAATATTPTATTANTTTTNSVSTTSSDDTNTLTAAAAAEGVAGEVANGTAELRDMEPASPPTQAPQTPQSHRRAAAVEEEEEEEVIEKRRYAARTAIADRLAANYWLLDPHVRARNIYDRLGILSPTGEVNFAPKK